MPSWSPFGWKSSKPRGTAGPFTPLQLTALRGWYKSDTGTTIVTGVSQWNDQSGNTNHLTQATGGKQPVVTAAAVNGLPAITFDGVDDAMGVAFALVQPSTVFIVFRQPTWTVFDMAFDGGGGVSNSMGLTQATASPGLALRAGVSAPTNNSLAVGTFGLATCIFNGASSTLQINSTAEANGDAGTTAGGGLVLGVRGNLGGNFGNVDIAEVAVMAAVATAAERLNFRTYSQARYGVGA